MARDAKERLEKQRLRQRAYRARMKAEQRLSHEDLARALLDVAIAESLRNGHHDDLMRFLNL